MMQLFRKKKYLVLLVGLLGLLLLIVLGVSNYQNDEFEPEESFEVNELTGEITRITNAGPEQAGVGDELIIYGYAGLEDSLSHIQRELFREQTVAYIGSNYQDRIEAITIDPNTIEFLFPGDREEVVKFSFLMEEHDDIVDVTLRLLGRVGLEITYENSNPAIADKKTEPISKTADIDFTGDGVPPEERGE